MTPALSLHNGYCATCGRDVADGEITGIEYTWDDPDHYDGVSEWMHLPCGRREGRWTGRHLTEDDDREPRYGGRGLTRKEPHG